MPPCVAAAHDASAGQVHVQRRSRARARRRTREPAAPPEHGPRARRARPPGRRSRPRGARPGRSRSSRGKCRRGHDHGGGVAHGSAAYTAPAGSAHRAHLVVSPGVPGSSSLRAPCRHGRSARGSRHQVGPRRGRRWDRAVTCAPRRDRAGQARSTRASSVRQLRAVPVTASRLSSAACWSRLSCMDSPYAMTTSSPRAATRSPPQSVPSSVRERLRIGLGVEVQHVHRGRALGRLVGERVPLGHRRAAARACAPAPGCRSRTSRAARRAPRSRPCAGCGRWRRARRCRSARRCGRRRTRRRRATPGAGPCSPCCGCRGSPRAAGTPRSAWRAPYAAGTR